jgi:hypothetical protein
MKYHIPYTLGRGYCSLDPRKKMLERFRESGRRDLIILILSDYDLAGEEIAGGFARSMRDDFGARVLARKVCLTEQQVEEYNLPVTFDPSKKDERHVRWAEEHGARELEALPPARRSGILERAIVSVLDIEMFNTEVRREKEDATKLAALREKIIPLILEASRG